MSHQQFISIGPRLINLDYVVMLLKLPNNLGSRVHLADGTRFDVVGDDEQFLLQRMKAWRGVAFRSPA